MMGRWILALVAMLTIGACGDKEEKVYFDGNHYPAKAKHATKEDRKSFVATVRRVKQGLSGARAAGEHAGTTYCVENYGTSTIEWVIGPDADQALLQQKNDNLVLTGTCVTW